MRVWAQDDIGLTAGERRVLFAYAILALIGAALALLVLLRVRPGALFERPLDTYDWWTVLSGAIGAGLALRLMQVRFGHPGRAGLKAALIGIGGVTLAAPVIAGTLVLPLYGTMFGPLALAVTFAAAPFAGVVWLATLAAVHALFAMLRAERDSIFAPAPRITRRGNSG